MHQLGGHFLQIMPLGIFWEKGLGVIVLNKLKEIKKKGKIKIKTRDSAAKWQQNVDYVKLHKVVKFIVFRGKSS